MTIAIATASDIGVIKRLLQLGRYVYANIADEDVPAVLARGMTVLGGGSDHPWGALMVDPEPRPASLPADAPNRAQVRAIALRHGPWTEDGVMELTSSLRALAPAELRPLSLLVYATEPWLQRALVAAGFSQVDTVIYLHLRLRGQNTPASAVSVDGAGDAPASESDASESAGSEGDGSESNASVTLRPATMQDIDALAHMDARAFDAIWHYPANDLLELLMRGRLQLAEVEGVIAGYTGMLYNNNGEAHLARLAVNPDFQGMGIGRRLLLDAIETARSEGYRDFALNTQRSNQRSQSLYHSAGLTESGIALPVFVMHIT